MCFNLCCLGRVGTPSAPSALLPRGSFSRQPSQQIAEDISQCLGGFVCWRHRISVRWPATISAQRDLSFIAGSVPPAELWVCSGWALSEGITVPAAFWHSRTVFFPNPCSNSVLFSWIQSTDTAHFYFEHESSKFSLQGVWYLL